MLQTNHVMHDRDHRFVFRFSVAVCHRDGNLFVMAKNHFRLIVATVIDDRIMNAAKGRAGVERSVLDIKGLH